MKSGRVDIPKLLFYVALSGAALFLAFSYGLHLGINQTTGFDTIMDTKKHIVESFGLVNKEITTVTKIHPTHFLQPSRYEGSGVTVNTSPDNQEDLILMAGFFENGNQLRLIKRDGTVVAKWPVEYSKIFADTSFLPRPPKTDWNVDTNGAMALPDGSVVFNFDYCGTVKLDRCGNVVLEAGACNPSFRGACPGRRILDTRKAISHTEQPFEYPPVFTAIFRGYHYEGIRRRQSPEGNLHS